MILTPLEMVTKTPITKDFPLVELSPLIEIEEFIWFENCDLGANMYKALVNDLSTVPNDIKEWSRTKTYDEDAYVTFYGSVLRSTRQPNTIDPSCDEFGAWERVPKFKTECVNLLWDNYISTALSYYILSEHLVEITYKISGKGTTKYSDDFRQNTTGLITIDRGERYDLQSAIKRNADKFYDTMVRKIKASTCEVALLANFMLDCQDECKPKSGNRRIAFRH